MGLKFLPVADSLRLLDVRTYNKVNEDGTTKTLKYAKFADEATYDSNEFMLPSDFDLNTLKVQTHYIVELDVDGKWTRIKLTPAETNAKKSSGFPAQQ